MIEFQQVTKHYPGGHTALDSVDLSIRHGELLVLAGHSGAGKSTLLKLIAGLERPSSGHISASGSDIGSMPRKQLPYWRRSLGIVMQEHRLLLDRSVLANIMLPLVLRGTPYKEAKTRALTALERVGLAALENAHPASLSGGEQQRVAIARAVVNRPSILLADEPTAHLDPAYARDIAALFRSFHSAGVTLVLATHDDTLFSPWGARRVELAHGKVLA